MAFRLPNFNLNVNLWRHASPLTGAPDLLFKANLRPSIRPSTTQWNEVGVEFIVELLCPALTDIRGVINAGGADYVEVPAGSGRFYTVNWVDDVAKGFPNEYRVACMNQRPGHWPTPLT